MNGIKGIVAGKFERLKSLIPGFAEREGVGTNEVDTEFRLHLSEKVFKGLERMGEIKMEFSDDGKVVILALMDKSIGRLSGLCTTLKNTHYSHNFKTSNPGGLDSLYDYDMTLLEEVDKLDLMVENIATSDGYEPKVREELKKLDQFLNDIEDLLSRRN